MTVTEDAYKIIRRWEGFRPKWYADAAGAETIGYGLTRTLLESLEPARISAPISKKEGAVLLEKAVEEHFAPRLEALVDTPLPQPDCDALVSFVYNVGTGAFKRSTMRTLYNEGNFEEARQEYTKWIYADGQKLDGLLARRKDEQDLAQEGALPDCTRIDKVDPAPLASLERRANPDELSFQMDLDSYAEATA